MIVKLKLTEKEIAYLRTFKKSGDHSLREFNCATILLFLDRGLTISEIENLLEVDRSTIWRIRERYLEHGLEVVLVEGKRSDQPAR